MAVVLVRNWKATIVALLFCQKPAPYAVFAEAIPLSTIVSAVRRQLCSMHISVDAAWPEKASGYRIVDSHCEGYRGLTRRSIEV